MWLLLQSANFWVETTYSPESGGRFARLQDYLHQLIAAVFFDTEDRGDILSTKCPAVFQPHGIEASRHSDYCTGRELRAPIPVTKHTDQQKDRPKRRKAQPPTKFPVALTEDVRPDLLRSAVPAEGKHEKAHSGQSGCRPRYKTADCLSSLVLPEHLVK